MSDPAVWLVTGCSSGLGRALAERVLAHGDRVIATARHPDSLEDLANEFPDACRALPLDVTDAGQVKDVVSGGSRIFGRLDVVVNNAGYGLIGAFEELDRDSVARNFETNLFGALEVIRAALPILRTQGSGQIVNISAAAAISNYPGFSIYGASKWALEGVSESLAAELKPLGIGVMLVEPGPFRTDFVRRSMERAERRIEAYDGTSGRFFAMLESMDGKQSGDPSRAANAIIAAVRSAHPPMRLVLGKYANDKVRRKCAATLRELGEWEDIALDVEIEGY